MLMSTGSGAHTALEHISPVSGAPSPTSWQRALEQGMEGLEGEERGCRPTRPSRDCSAGCPISGAWTGVGVLEWSNCVVDVLCREVAAGGCCGGLVEIEPR
jgi:hypothetical protein